MENNNKIHIFLKLLNLDEFKTKKCLIKKKHDVFKCFFYHSKEDKRRNYNLVNYDLIKCNKLNKFNYFCKLAHNNTETLYHPNFYKKKICKQFFLKSFCIFDKYCSFAHTEKELRIKLIHKLKMNYEFFINIFKTEFCPWGNIEHNKTFCVYSHNFQDYKRNNITVLKPKKCKNWDSKKIYKNYLDGCKNGLKCNYCHGKIEYNFHPLIYKKKNCKINYKNCGFKQVCYFFHQEKDINQYLNDFLVPQNKRIY